MPPAAPWPRPRISTGLLAAHTITWIVVYFIIFQGVQSSGKVVYFTALMPYVALAAFVVRGLTLPNAFTGLKFFMVPDLSTLMNIEVWQRAASQIFYSLGVGFGVGIAFASYNSEKDDYIGNGVKVSLINCFTSVLAGFAVFPILGYLVDELKTINPCIAGDDIGDLSSIGLSGTGLAFIAFPIAISKMPLPYFWAFVFFCMLFCLGVDSEFAAIEGIMTVIHDTGMTGGMSKPKLAALVCGVCWFLGLIFITRGGIYWFTLFDYYTCVVSLFFVTFMECFWVTWGDSEVFARFSEKTKSLTGQTIGVYYRISWKWTCPALTLLLFVLGFDNYDLMGAATSKPYPEGSGFLPMWSIGLGWKLALLPVFAFAAVYMVSLEQDVDKKGESSEASEVQEKQALGKGKQDGL